MGAGTSFSRRARRALRDAGLALVGGCVLAVMLDAVAGRAIRFTTLTAICDALRCAPGDLFSVLPPR